jgi:hypothetical protein
VGTGRGRLAHRQRRVAAGRTGPGGQAGRRCGVAGRRGPTSAGGRTLAAWAPVSKLAHAGTGVAEVLGRPAGPAAGRGRTPEPVRRRPEPACIGRLGRHADRETSCKSHQHPQRPRA